MALRLRIDYFRDGVKVGSVPCPGTLDDALRAVNGGMIKLDADVARILDMDKNGKEISVVKR